jgi:TRAP transporter 4TM/12TM fusion protein
MEVPSISSRDARRLVAGIALLLTFVQFLPLYTGGYQYAMVFLGTHVGTTTAIAYLMFSWRARRTEEERVPLPDLLLSGSALACAGYLAWEGRRIAERIPAVDAVYPLDYLFGVGLILILLEACRRVAGIVLTTVAILFIAYIFLGPYLPTFMSHRGMTLMRFIDLQILSTAGIFGSPVSASAHMVFYFLLVGAFLERSGAGQLFVNIAYGFTARTWGGAGKAAVVASALFGTVSGSAVANVLLSGIMTIPLMKRAGFKPTLAGAIEATASTGGQLAPPIMGAAAFILADIVGVPYYQVVIAAIVPALLYYTSLLALIHFHALRNGLAPDYTIPIRQHLAGLRQRWHLLVPLVFMVFLLMQRFSLMTVGAYTIAAIMVLSLLRRATWMGPGAAFEAIVKGGRSAVEVAIPSAVAGIIVGTLVQTGLALRLQRFLLQLADGSLAISLFGAMVLTIILGMGMPTAAAYIVSAILVAPALVELGVQPLVAHLFIFYFAILSMVTPPVALSAYAAAGIAGARLWQTGFKAFILAIPGFLIPYAFALNPGLILQEGLVAAVSVIIPAVFGVLSLAAAVGGYAFGPLSMVLRVLMFVAGPMLISPNIQADLAGAAILVAVLGYQIWRRANAGLADAPARGPSIEK